MPSVDYNQLQDSQKTKGVRTFRMLKMAGKKRNFQMVFSNYPFFKRLLEGKEFRVDDSKNGYRDCIEYALMRDI